MRLCLPSRVLSGRNKFNIAIKQAWCTFQYWLSQYCRAHVFCARRRRRGRRSQTSLCVWVSEFARAEHNSPRRCGDNDEDTHTLILSLSSQVVKKRVSVFSERGASLSSPGRFSRARRDLLIAPLCRWDWICRREAARVQTLWKLASAAQNTHGRQMAAQQNETRGLTRSLSLSPVFDANGITRLYIYKRLHKNTERGDAGKGGF